MKKLTLLTIFLLTVSTAFAQNSSQFKTDKVAVENCIRFYAESINKADTVMGGKVFLKSDAVSFIHPKGHAKGWEGVKGIYSMFNNAFTQRALKTYDEDIKFYDDMAVAVFYWVFDATFKDGAQIQTKGRETQVYKKIDGEWKIVHVHYSPMPVTGKRDGF